MNIVCIGVDPATLYLGLLLKRRDPSRAVCLIDAAAGADAPASALICNPVRPRFALADDEAQTALNAAMTMFDRVTVTAATRTFDTRGLRYASVHEPTLRDRLRERAVAAGCVIVAPGPAANAAVTNADVVVIADRTAATTFIAGPTAEATPGRNRFCAFASPVPSDALRTRLRATAGGWIHAVAWPHAGGTTIVVEAPAAVIAANRLDGAAEALAALRAQFGDLFNGVADNTEIAWQPFVSVRSQRWHDGKAVLIGRAAYTAHWSVGLDLRLALEDAEALAQALTDCTDVPAALTTYERARRPKAESLQRAAGAAATWFEHVDLHAAQPFEQMVFSLITASMRITYARIEKAAPELVRSIDARLAPANGGSNRPPPPMFAPITLRSLTIPNRVVVSPMCMYSAKDGTINDFHLVHLGSRAIGGAGLVITEMTDVLPEGRISLHCAGMYKGEHVDAWRRVTDFIHANSPSKVAIQLAHAGRKGSLTRSWEGHQNLGTANWEILAPSAIPFMEGRQTPRAMNRADMDAVRDAFARAAAMSDQAGFDMIELHFAHGYLISSFISPAANHRTDEYGGSLENRMRFPLEVFRAVRAVWPAAKPISTRISAVDWVEDGTTIDDAVAIGRMLHAAGNDILAVSTGGVVSGPRPAEGRAYQAVFSDRIRNELGIPTMSVGGLVSHADINTLIAAGRADMAALGRGSLEDAYFVRHAATDQNYAGLAWPSQYRRAGEVRLRGT